MHLRVGAIGVYHVKSFETNNNYFRLSSLYPSFSHLTSIFRVALKVYLTHHCMRQVRLLLNVSCVARSFSNQDSLTLIKLPEILLYEFGLFIYLFIYLFCALLKINSFESSDKFERIR